MQKDGTQSRSVNNLPEENQQPTHNDEVALGAGKTVATKQEEQFTSSSSSLTSLPIDQRKWNGIPAGRNIDDKYFEISKQMTGLNDITVISRW